jgi:hypothetical protein
MFFKLGVRQGFHMKNIAQNPAKAKIYPFKNNIPLYLGGFPNKHH